MIKKVFFKVFIILNIVWSLLMQNIIFSAPIVNTTKYAGEFDNCVFLGDSYTQMMPYYFGSSINWEGHEGYTVEQLTMYLDNVVKQQKQNIIYFIGPNDYLRQNSTDDFYYTLEYHIRYLKEHTRSRIFFCSYLDFMYNELSIDQNTMKYKLASYDDMIQILCQNENITYINLWDIADVSKMRGMSDVDGENDMFHYGKKFYEEFFVHIKNDLAKKDEQDRILLQEILRRQLEMNTQKIVAANLTK